MNIKWTRYSPQVGKLSKMWFNLCETFEPMTSTYVFLQFFWAVSCRIVGLFWSLLWSPWDSVSTERETKHILSTLRQKVLCLCKLLFYIKIPCDICSKGFWNKINTLHTTGILTSMTVRLLAYLMKMSVIRSNLEHRVVFSNISLAAVNSAFPHFLGERNVTLKLFVLKYYFLISLQREKQ